MTLDNRMHWIECEIRHEQQPGVHTYHLCPECETNQCRSVKCAACWTRDLDRLRPMPSTARNAQDQEVSS